MDPNANLKEQVKRARELIAFFEKYPFDGSKEPDALRIAELALAMDEWIRKGGFLPEAWAKSPQPLAMDQLIYLDKLTKAAFPMTNNWLNVCASDFSGHFYRATLSIQLGNGQEVHHMDANEVTPDAAVRKLIAGMEGWLRSKVQDGARLLGIPEAPKTE